MVLRRVPDCKQFPIFSKLFLRGSFVRGGTGERAELQPLLMSTTGTLSPGAFRAVIDLAAPADGGRVRKVPLPRLGQRA